MNTLIEKKRISELVCGENFSYVLGENQIFSSTEYKVLQSQTDSCFVRCMKMLYNGQIQLYYLTGEYKPLSSLIPSLDPDSFLVITANMLSDMIEVKQNGFLSCQNIDISFDHIYVDPTTLKIRLIYLPLSVRIFESYSDFESEYRTALIRAISQLRFSSAKVQKLSSDLSNALLSFDDIHSHIKGDKRTVTEHRTELLKRTETTVSSIKMVAINAPVKAELRIDKDEYFIGKKADVCDGVVSFNKMISRRHCRINHAHGSYYITDLQSANGTYVNKVRLSPNKPVKIEVGDVIRLADSDFQIVKG